MYIINYGLNYCLCVFVRICAYLCAFVCICAYLCAFVHICAHLCVFVRIYAYLCVCRVFETYFVSKWQNNWSKFSENCKKCSSYQSVHITIFSLSQVGYTLFFIRIKFIRIWASNFQKNKNKIRIWLSFKLEFLSELKLVYS